MSQKWKRTKRNVIKSLEKSIFRQIGLRKFVFGKYRFEAICLILFNSPKSQYIHFFFMFRRINPGNIANTQLFRFSLELFPIARGGRTEIDALYQAIPIKAVQIQRRKSINCYVIESRRRLLACNWINTLWYVRWQHNLVSCSYSASKGKSFRQAKKSPFIGCEVSSKYTPSAAIDKYINSNPYTISI